MEEAIAHAFRAWVPTRIPEATQRILVDPKCREELGPDAPPFWIMAAALAAFVEQEGAGLLPLSGVLPDVGGKGRSADAMRCDALPPYLVLFLTQLISLTSNPSPPHARQMKADSASYIQLQKM